jgi:hypothetical protein
MADSSIHVVSLFRVVQGAELEDLRAVKALRTTERSIEGKLFWTTKEDAERFERLLQERLGIGPSWIVEVHVENQVLERLSVQRTDGRVSRLVHEDDLPWFNGVVNEFVIPDSEVER